jgi:hypothetical protein
MSNASIDAKRPDFSMTNLELFAAFCAVSWSMLQNKLAEPFAQQIMASPTPDAILAPLICDTRETTNLELPNMSSIHHSVVKFACFVLIGCYFVSVVQAEDKSKPNFIIIFADDQGYNDLGCFGSTTIKTPNIDRLASEGRKFTSFYVACSVCSPSRAALMTGCYPKRVGMQKHVLFPRSDYGLHPSEHTIADHLKSHGYATACIGKWHLGHLPELLPRQQGFDSYFGIPYSNDMNHPDNKGKPRLTSDELWTNQKSAITLWKTSLNFQSTKERSPAGTPTKRSSLSPRTRTSHSFCISRIRCLTFRFTFPMTFTTQIPKTRTHV